jgi:hypothetical protein
VIDQFVYPLDRPPAFLCDQRVKRLEEFVRPIHVDLSKNMAIDASGFARSDA